MKTFLPNNFILVLLAFLFVFSSCDKKDSDDVDPNAGQAACKLTHVASGNDNPDIIEYNSKGFVSKVTFAGNDYMMFHYDSNNRLTKVEEYDNGELDYYATYSYTGNNISKVEWFSADGSREDTETIKYDAQNRIIEILDDYEGETNKTTFTYNNQGNIEKRERFDSDGIMYSRTSYTNYDDKHRPLSALRGYFDYYQGSSKNNPGRETYAYFYDGQQQGEFVSEYAYTYNDKGFPTKTVETYDGRTYITNFTYQCN